MKIRTRLTLGFLACGVAPLLVAGAVELRLVAKRPERSSANTRRTDIRARATALLEQQRGLKTSVRSKSTSSRIRDQAVTFAENRMVVEAMRHLPGLLHRRTAKQVGPAAVVPADALRKRTPREYYANDFGSRCTPSRTPARRRTVDAWLDQLDAESIALQHAYIRANEHPLGSKHLLDTRRRPRPTTAGTSTAVIHPVDTQLPGEVRLLRYLLDRRRVGRHRLLGLQGTRLHHVAQVDGPYAGTNFGRAFREACELENAGEFSLR